MTRWHAWKYKNITFLIIGLLVTFLLYQQEAFHQFLKSFGTLGYLSAFLAGMMFVSIFTVTTGALILLVLAEQLPLIPLGLIAGGGAILGDFLIFKFVRDGLAGELALVKENIKDEIEEVDFIDESLHSKTARHLKKNFKALLHTQYFSWIMPAMGLAILTSPFPDEMGVGLMGISKIKPYHLLMILAIIKPVSVFLVITAATFIKP